MLTYENRHIIDFELTIENMYALMLGKIFDVSENNELDLRPTRKINCSNLQVCAADLESGKYRSDLSLPNGVVIKESSIPKAGSGVWAETPVPKGVRFGPYEGTIVDDIEDAHSGYCWQVRRDSYQEV